MKRRLFNLCSLVILSLLTACQDYDFGYKSYEPDTNETKYSRRFANRDDVNVNITTETPGAPYFVYFSNPYNADGSFNGATAYLEGCTPISTQLSVPRHVDSLYVVSPMRDMRVLAAGDVMIEDKNLFQPVGVTRVNITEYPYDLPKDEQVPYYFDNNNNHAVGSNPHINDMVMNYVNSCFPSGNTTPNVDPSEQYKNTDLTFKDEEDKYVAVWVTVLGTGTKKTGNKDNGDPNAKVWFYIYKDEENPDPTGQIMYGIDEQGKICGQGLNFTGGAQLDNPLLKTTDITPQNKYPTVFLGYIKSGYNIGFCYQGLENGGGSQGVAKVRYTTPSYNSNTQGAGNQNISDGFIIHQSLEINGEMHAYNFVGFENRSTTKNGGNYTSDDDFNDILLCIETNPEIRPKEEVHVDPVIEKKTSEGYYLFEDLYGHAESNDNDFNDAVIFYKKSIYNLGSTAEPLWMCDFSAELLAYACINTNEVGVYHNGRSFRLFEGIKGENNMDIAPFFNGSGKEEITFKLDKENDVILPYLRTTNTADGETTEFDPADPNKFNIYPTTYASKEFPYAMEIPFVEGHPFLWMQEGVIITDGYSNWNTDSWYTNPTDESKLVPRAEGSTY